MDYISTKTNDIHLGKYVPFNGSYEICSFFLLYTRGTITFVFRGYNPYFGG